MDYKNTNTAFLYEEESYVSRHQYVKMEYFETLHNTYCVNIYGSELYNLNKSCMLEYLQHGANLGGEYID